MNEKVNIDTVLLRAAIETLAAAVHPSMPFGQVNGLMVALSALLRNHGGADSSI
jgi:hypothetical protein